MTAYFRAMRLERWPRSLAIFAGTAAFFLLNRDSQENVSALWIVSRSVFIFILTWAISTANYVVNEIVDIPYDIHHPTKKDRPLIRGEIRRGPFAFLGTVLALSSLAAAFYLFSPPFFFSLLALLIAGFIYNIKPVRTKDIPFLDSISESANNPIRFLIGWFAFSLPDQFPPVSLLLCWWSFGNFLMVAKRLSEFRLLQARAADYRSSLRRYSKLSLIVGLAVSTLVFFVTYFAFAIAFKLQSFVFLSPLVFFYFFLFFRKTLQEHEVMEEPEKLLTRPLYALYTLFLVITFFLSILLDSIGN